MQPQTNSPIFLEQTLPPAPQPQSRRGGIVALLFCVLLLIATAMLFVYRQDVWDWYRLRNYTAPANVAALADTDGLTPYARKVFYVNAPQIQDKSTFRQSCLKSGAREQSIVLGCYQSYQNGIYVLNVTDPRLKGVEEVTAAHEMLHAAYDRLSASERSRIDGQLQDFYENGLKDDRIRSTIDSYRKTEPYDLVNEMHSIFATEVKDLPQPLEAYYTQYFTNRKAVVAIADAYQSEFTRREAQVTGYDAQLKALKASITSLQDDLKRRQEAIAQQETTLDAQRSSNPQAYNAAVPGFNASIDAYNAKVSQLESQIAQYNALVETRNKVAFEENALSDALNANVQTINR